GRPLRSEHGLRASYLCLYQFHRGYVRTAASVDRGRDPGEIFCRRVSVRTPASDYLLPGRLPADSLLPSASPYQLYAASDLPGNTGRERRVAGAGDATALGNRAVSDRQIELEILHQAALDPRRIRTVTTGRQAPGCRSSYAAAQA